MFIWLILLTFSKTVLKKNPTYFLLTNSLLCLPNIILPVVEGILASISDMSALILFASPETRADCGRPRTSDKLSTLLPRDGGKLKRPGSPCFNSYIFKEKEKNSAEALP